MSFPGKVIKQTYLSEQDKKDIAFGVKNDVDFIACSFVSQKQDLLDVQAWLDELGAKDISLIAKIENQAGIDNIDEICEVCSGIMVARGDMGVEVAFEKLPAIQKQLITKCRLLGKRVITATEMLESMITNPRPTRAEISDVANAVYDGTSAIMLSGETAAGQYPVEAVQTMSKIAESTEQNINYTKRFHNAEFHIKNAVDAISHSTCGMSGVLQASAIVAMRLGQLTGMEREKIEAEYKELCERIAYFKELLADEKKLMGVIKEELLEIRKKWGDKRRTKITGDSAYDLVKLIYRMPAVIEEAGSKYEPSIVTRHIIQIASTFNRFYHDEHILLEDADERIAKIALVAAAGQAIRNGLHLLGIEAPERM
jgi:hypothetical protein